MISFDVFFESNSLSTEEYYNILNKELKKRKGWSLVNTDNKKQIVDRDGNFVAWISRFFDPESNTLFLDQITTRHAPGEPAKPSQGVARTVYDIDKEIVDTFNIQTVKIEAVSEITQNAFLERYENKDWTITAENIGDQKFWYARRNQH